MALYELHPFTSAEVANAPEEAGVYVLFQVETPLHVDGASNLRQRLREEKARLPQATHFAVETGYQSEREAAERVQKLKKELGRVREGWCAGPER